jgi:hypothetical protein
VKETHTQRAPSLTALLERAVLLLGLRGAASSICLVLAVLLPQPAWSQLEPGCPSHVWLGNSPSDAESPDWSEQAQGVANDGVSWFFTHNVLSDKELEGTPEGSLIKYQKNWRPVNGGDDEGKIAVAKIPQFLFEDGYWHWGDPDYYAGYVFVPLEGVSSGQAVIAVYRSSDLAFVDWIEVGEHQAKLGWVAIDPVDRTLYSSLSTLVADNPLLRYGMDLSKIDGTPGGFLVTPPTEVDVLDFDGGPIEGQFQYMQGGVFTPWRDLYLIVGKAGDTPASVRGGIHLFRRSQDDSSFRLIESSVNRRVDEPGIPVGSEVLFYEYHPSFTGLGEEPEGIDWWNQDNDPNARYPGQLHAILLDNQADDDNVWLKHYEVPYECMQHLDSDADGVGDWDEAYVYNTHPLLVDADGDGRENNIDNCPLDANADQADLDGDGLGDACDDDADGDVQTNADEEACGSDPLDAGSVAPDLDDDDAPDCVDPDDDGDGQTDTDELACGSDPADASSTSPDFDSDGALDCLDPDDDNDGVEDGGDACAGTMIPDAGIPSSGVLGQNRYSLMDDDLEFDRNVSRTEDTDRFTTADTAGCNASQIADELHLGRSHYRWGLSRSVLQTWVRRVGE